ncbi:hypothetical protein [Brevundimonas sp. NPDC058933]|uniref:hypothetical protein n=1 Tax=Brevundimonas sp. NPDC058933 TaxID=3346673 RepID=UPI003BEF4779
MTALQASTKKPLIKTRLIGFAAMGVCVLGYTGMGLALLAGKLEHLDMTHAALLAAVAALIGEIGLWVGAGCLGLTLFKKRKAMLDKLFGRKGQPAIPTSEV